MKYPEGQLYEALYAKYIHKRPVSELVDLAGDIKDKFVLDLCCGTGRIVKECIVRGAVVTGLDLSAEMSEGLMRWLESSNDSRHFLNITDVKSYLIVSSKNKHRFDVVFCRQAVNYWMDWQNAALLASIIVPGGAFIFNTFKNEPGIVPAVKEYNYQSHHFVEVSWLEDGNVVHHVQICDGLPPHTTKFRWIPRDEFMRTLSTHFELEVKEDGPTAIYICTRR